MEEELEETSSLRHRSAAPRHHHHQRRRAKKPPPPTTNYDDVFGGPPRHAVPFSGVPDDYSEVFGGVSVSCSIPFLDLPTAQMDGWDCASGDSVNGVDYREIFGRCDFADFAVPYEELFGRGNGGEGDIDMHFSPASANGRSSVNGRSGPQTTDPSLFTQESSNEDSIPYFDDLDFSVSSSEMPREYNTSYNKASRAPAKELLHTPGSVPQPQTGFTFVVEPTKPLPEHIPVVTEGTIMHENSVKQIPISSANSQSISNREPVPLEVSSPNVTDIDLQAKSTNLPTPGPKFVSNERQKTNTFPKTDSVSNFSTETEQAQQEKPKPLLKSDSLPPTFDFVPNLKLDKREKPKLKSRPNAFSKSESLPPGLGGFELDAMKEAMEFAQARLKTAKELHERRREGKITELPLKKKHVKEENLECFEREKPRVLRSISLASNFSKSREFMKLQGEVGAAQSTPELEKSGKWRSDEEFHELTSIVSTKLREDTVGSTGTEPLVGANRESMKINGLPPTELESTGNLNADVSNTENIEQAGEIKYGGSLKREEKTTIGSFEVLTGGQEPVIEIEKETGENDTEALKEDADVIPNMEEKECTDVEAETEDGKGSELEVRAEIEEEDSIKLDEEMKRQRKTEDLEKERQREQEMKEEEKERALFQLEEEKERALQLEEEKERARILEEERELQMETEREEKEREEKERKEQEKIVAEEEERLEKEREEKLRKLTEERERERKLEEERREEKLREKEMVRKLEEEKERERQLEEEIEKERERVRTLEEEREQERERVRKLEEEKQREREMARKLEKEKERERELEEEIEKERERIRKLEEERELEREKVRKLEEERELERELEREKVRKLEEEREQERERVRKLEEEREKERMEKEREQKEREKMEQEREEKERERLVKERELKEMEKKLEEEKEKQRMEKEKEEIEKRRRMEKEREDKEVATRLEVEMRKERERAEEMERMAKLQGEKTKDRKIDPRRSDEERERERRMKEKDRKPEGRKSDEEREKGRERKSDEEREREKERRARNEREVEEREREEERKREREKDRLAMERATQERAERIAIERITAARQRAVENKEKEELNNRGGGEVLEKRRPKGEDEKKERDGERNAREARLRAERAAVERATAEARERAIEKAKAEAEKEKERLVRYKSFNRVSSQDHTQESHFKRTQSDSALSQGHGESALRHKARLERQQRTAERAAKALAEKNRRDIMAQREQAERDRIAEHLDADVKRWSSGKEGNLRALLSTLQYILGQNSGWQPIHLTEVITAADVKKAYRKATLYVHPDKLQQRGASIQQKYICEKVFDLLKEAWNKFNSEER